MKKLVLVFSAISLCLSISQALHAVFVDEDAVIAKRKARIEQNVTKMVEFFDKNELGVAMRSFEKDDRWNDPASTTFVFSDNGVCLLYGKELHVLWSSFKNERSLEFQGVEQVGSDFFSRVLERAETGGWVNYDWNYSTSYSYVKMAEKDGRKFVIGAGFYPDSAAFEIKQMVKKAIRYAQEFGAAETFLRINNPRGIFTKGPGYLWAYKMGGADEGVCYAHGENPVIMVGQNRLNWKDSAGRYRNKDMIAMVKRSGSGWIEYQEDGIEKRAYVESFVDPKTKQSFIIGGGYYPTVNDNLIKNFVKRAVNYLKENGPIIAFRDFSSRTGGFVQGPLRVFVLNTEGVMMADGENPIFIGQNLMDNRDVEGKPITRGLIDLALKSGSGWFTFVDTNDYKSAYVERVTVPDGTFIVGAGYWPQSKVHTAEALAEKAVGFMQSNELTTALKMFTGTTSDFLHGDLFISVYTEEGICLAYGLDRERIWFDEKTIIDKRGYPYIDQVIAKANRGGGWVEYNYRGCTYRGYVKLVQKPVSQSRAATILLEEKDEIEIDKESKVTRKAAKKKQKLHDDYIIVVGYYQ